jgi:mono/diheme cytochrome c family protein
MEISCFFAVKATMLKPTDCIGYQEDTKVNQRDMLTASVLAAVISLAGCTEGSKKNNSNEGSDSDSQVIFLDQGFSKDDRLSYYNLSQGSQLIPYNWFLALEQADNQSFFRDNAHMRELGYIPQPADSMQNPDGLPIGFTKDDNPDTVGIYGAKKAFLGANYQQKNYPSTNAWLGLTCAACHTSQLDYDGKSIRIDGGAALVDHQTLMVRLAAALQATHEDASKMERFSRRVLDSNWSQGEQDALTSRVIAYSDVLNRLVEQNATDLAYGFGRLDAFGAILNRITETGLEIPENHAESNAPVSYPFLWTTTELDWVQWNSAVSNAIARNVGEVLGVYAHMQLSGTPQTGQFYSTARIDNLDRLEDYVSQLKAPDWPSEVLGSIDSVKAAQGKLLYAANCKGCHVIRDENGDFPRRPAQEGEIKQFIITKSPPLEAIRTDPQMLQNVLTRFAEPGDLKPHLPEQLPETMQKGNKVAAVVLLSAAVSGVIDRQLQEEGLEGEALRDAKIRLNGGRTTAAQLVPPPQIIATYKARPLNGVWATAPFLHNGSVPNLYGLLLPEDRRIKTFHVGTRNFDPIKVGYEEDSNVGFEFDTAQPGNRNTGHSGPGYTQLRSGDQWRDFTDDERWALIEYLKTLK